MGQSEIFFSLWSLGSKQLKSICEDRFLWTYLAETIILSKLANRNLSWDQHELGFHFSTDRNFTFLPNLTFDWLEGHLILMMETFYIFYLKIKWCNVEGMYWKICAWNIAG